MLARLDGCQPLAPFGRRGGRKGRKGKNLGKPEVRPFYSLFVNYRLVCAIAEASKASLVWLAHAREEVKWEQKVSRAMLLLRQTRTSQISMLQTEARARAACRQTSSRSVGLAKVSKLLEKRGHLVDVLRHSGRRSQSRRVHSHPQAFCDVTATTFSLIPVQQVSPCCLPISLGSLRYE
eukprot:scaffold948_cov213-Pinguiococcus_pyrenoidosus.AAC.1